MFRLPLPCLLLLLAPLGCAPDPAAPADDDDATDVPADDDDSSGEETTPAPLAPPVTEEIGPDGGALSLEDGTTLTIPAGALSDTVTVTLTPVTPEAPLLDQEGWLRFGTAFTVEPWLTSAGDDFELLVPIERVPDGRPAGDVALLRSLDGIGDPGPGAEDLQPTVARLHTPIRQDGEDADGVWFSLGRVPSGSTLQPIAQPLTAPEGPWGGVTSPTSLFQCAQRFPNEPGFSASTRVWVWNGAVANIAAHRATLVAGGGSGADFDAAVARFFERTCWSSLKTLQFFEQQVGLVDRVGAGFLDVTVGWRPLNPDGSCAPKLAEASGAGVTVYMNFQCDATFSGSVLPTLWGSEQASGYAGWNLPYSAGQSVLNFADDLEQTLAHEVFHWFHDRADGFDDGFFMRLSEGEGALLEGGAEAAAEMAYDQPGMRWAEWDLAAGNNWETRYLSHSLWRFIDWTQQDPEGPSILKRLLDYAPIGAGAGVSNNFAGILDDELRLMMPPRTGYGARAALADFTVAHDFSHDYERWTEPGPPPEPASFDRTPDVQGVQESEEDPGQLWTSRSTIGGAPTVDRILNGIPFVQPSSLPYTQPAITMPSWSAVSLPIDLSLLFPTGNEACVRLTVEASQAGTPVGDLAARLVHDPDWTSTEPRADTVWRLETIRTSPGQPSAFFIGSDLAQSPNTLMLAVVNGNFQPVELTVSLDRPGEHLGVLGRSSIWGGVGFWDRPVLPGVDPQQRPVNGGNPDLLPLNGSPRYGAWSASGELLLSHAWGWLTKVDPTVGQEAEIDWDGNANNGVTRVELGAASEPRGIAALQSDFGLVATAAGLVLFSEGLGTIAGTLSLADLGLTDAGDRPYDVVALSDDSYAFVTIRDPARQGSVVPDEVLVIDLQAFISGGTGPGMVYARIDTGADTNPLHLALSPDETALAVTLTDTNRVAIIDVQQRAIFDLGEPGFPTQFVIPAPWTDSEIPTDVVWHPDGSAVYVGYEGGSIGSALQANGTVRKCVLATGSCQHEVGVGPGARPPGGAWSSLPSGVRSLAMIGCGANRRLAVADASGYVTFLPLGLFEPGDATSGMTEVGGAGWIFDGTGGCIIDPFSWPYAESCTDTSAPPGMGLDQGSGSYQAQQLGELVLFYE